MDASAPREHSESVPPMKKTTSSAEPTIMEAAGNVFERTSQLMQERDLSKIIEDTPGARDEFLRNAATGAQALLVFRNPDGTLGVRNQKVFPDKLRADPTWVAGVLHTARGGDAEKRYRGVEAWVLHEQKITKRKKDFRGMEEDGPEEMLAYLERFAEKEREVWEHEKKHDASIDVGAKTREGVVNYLTTLKQESVLDDAQFAEWMNVVDKLSF